MTPRVVTDPESFARTASRAPDGARVPVEVRLTVDDPFRAYCRARKGRVASGFYLETTGGQDGWGYFGTEAIDRVTIYPEDGSSIAALVQRLSRERLARGDCQIPYPCGGVGWLSYDVARELEALPDTTRRERELPRLQLCIYNCIAAWKEPREGDETTLCVTACPRVEGNPAEAYKRGRETALQLAREALEGDPSLGEPPVEKDQATFRSDCGREAFAERVRTVKDYIREGDTFQANVSQRLRAPAAVHPVIAYAALREVNPAPYSGLLEFPEIDLVGASPELLLERRGDRLVTEPIAGTRPRGSTPEEDRRLEEDLRSDEKERAEHAMLVDLERNDLGKVSAYGSVEVSEYRRVDRYSEVMHLVSKVEGRLDEDPDIRAFCRNLPLVLETDRDTKRLGAAVAATFPGGTITGAPKPRTMEIIDEVEETRRGPYTGSIGMFGFDGLATLNIIIRTLVRFNDEYHLRVGAGIVHDSDPEREYEETLDKSRALVTAIDRALGEHADFDVENI